MNFTQNIVFILVCFLCTFVSSGNNGCPSIKSKRRWGGRPSLLVDYQTIPVKYVIIHHTVTGTCSTYSDCATQVKNIQDYHMMDLGWGDIGYNFLIGNDGNIYEGVGWHKVGAHAIGYNSKSIGIAFIGDFSNNLPSPSALEAAKSLLKCGVEIGELDRRYRLLGGRQVIATESPGLTLFNEIQDWPNHVANP